MGIESNINNGSAVTGAAGGDLSGTYPNPTAAKTNGVTFGALATQSGAWQNYTPALQGSSDNPTATYPTQIGRYCQIGNLCFFSINLVTSTMTKTTLTDVLRISLPVAAASVVSDTKQVASRVENGTAILNGTLGEIASGTQYIQFRNLPLAAGSALLTYALLSLGVLTNTITFRASGVYEV